MPGTQSAYRRHHSTHTALLKVLNDIATAVDCERVMALCLLYLTSVFDTVDQSILLELSSLTSLSNGSAHISKTEFFEFISRPISHYQLYSGAAFPMDQCWVHCCLPSRRLSWRMS